MSYLDAGERVLQIYHTKDKFILVGITGQENMSELFHYELDLVSDNTAINANDYIGNKISFSVAEENSDGRQFSGFVKQIIAGPILKTGNRNYRMMVVPNLWLLQQSSNSRVYQEKSVLDILEDVIGQCPFYIDREFNCSQEHAVREYCVQYQETDFNFISRLMEEEGLFYFFRHEVDRHILVICDNQNGYVTAANMAGSLKGELSHYYEENYSGQITSWTEVSGFYTGQYELESYDFEKVDVLSSTAKGNKLTSSIHNQVVDSQCLSNIVDKSQLDAFANIRMEADEVSNHSIHASSNYPFLSCGGEFKLAEHGDKNLVGKTFVLTSLNFSYSENEHVAGEPADIVIHNDFMCIPGEQVFRAQRKTKKPQIQGLLTAKVTSDSKDGPVVDTYGRIKIQMNWEFGKNKKQVANDCWVRVAQMNAGSGWGSLFLPDKDQEVLVSFVDGDPDSPIVIGSVYNGKNKSPYGEKDKASTRFGFKTSNGNEFALENSKDKEEVFIKAKRDMLTEVFNDKTLNIEEGKLSETLKQGDRIEVLEEGNKESTLEKGDLDIKLTKGNYTTKVDAGSTSFESGKDIELKVGSNSIKMDKKGITLKTPGGSLVLDSSGAVLKGLKVEIKGDTTFKAEGGVSAEVKGGVQAKLQSDAMVEVKGGAMASISGAIAKIN